MFSLKYFSTDLKSLTFATCLFGGILWTGKYMDSRKKLLASKPDSDYNSALATKIDFVNTVSVKTVLAVFYYYLATNVNSMFLKANWCDVEMLTNGYTVVLCGIGYEYCVKLYECLKVPNWKR